MIPLELLKQKETNKNSRKTFVENLRLCSEQAELHKREKRTLCQQCSGVFSNSYEERWQLDIGTLQELSYSSEKGCILCDLLKEAISSISSTGPSDKYRLSVDWDKSRLTIERCLNGYSRSRSLEEIPFFGGFVEKDIPVHAELDMFVDKGNENYLRS